MTNEGNPVDEDLAAKCQCWITRATELFLDKEGDLDEFLAKVPVPCQSAVKRQLRLIGLANQESEKPQTHDWKNEYQPLEKFDDGSMGDVYLVEPMGDGSIQAVMKSPQWLTDRERFLEETWNHILIPPHPNLVRWKYMRIFDEQPHIFMEYMEGGSLAELAKPSLRPNQEQWLRTFFDVAIQCCWAIEHLHTHRLIHKDIKPDNILYRSSDNSDRFVLADFGISSFLEPGTDFVQDRYCTECYAAPEQKNDGRAYFASDIFSLGASLKSMFAKPDEIPVSTMKSLLDEMTRDAHESRPSITGVSDKLQQLHEEIIGSGYHRQKPFLDDSAELTRSILKELEQPSSVFYDVARLMPKRTKNVKTLTAIQRFYARLLARRDDPAQAAHMALLIQIIFFRASNDGTLIQLDELESISRYVEDFLVKRNYADFPDTYAREFKEAACPLLRGLRPMTDPGLVPEVDRVMAIMECPKTIIPQK